MFLFENLIQTSKTEMVVVGHPICGEGNLSVYGLDGLRGRAVDGECLSVRKFYKYRMCVRPLTGVNNARVVF